MWPRYAVVLSAICQNDDGDEQVFQIKCDFRTEDNFDMHDGTFFDHLIEPINQFLEKNHPGYHVDDTIETYSHEFDGQPDIIAPLI